jgi:hypothetical protein
VTLDAIVPRSPNNRETWGDRATFPAQGFNIGEEGSR